MRGRENLDDSNCHHGLSAREPDYATTRPSQRYRALRSVSRHDEAGGELGGGRHLLHRLCYCGTA